MQTEKVVLTVKEATKKAGTKGTFWCLKNEKGLVYNAKIEDYAEINPGDILNAVFTTTEYEAKNGPNKGQMVKSRWLLKPGAEHYGEEKTPEAMVAKVMGEGTKVLPAKSAEDKIVAAILAICEDDVKALAKYREILGKL